MLLGEHEATVVAKCAGNAPGPRVEVVEPDEHAALRHDNVELP
jgi:hypothetical protein